MSEEILFSNIGDPNKIPETKIIDGGELFYPILNDIANALNLRGECLILIKFNNDSGCFSSEVVDA